MFKLKPQGSVYTSDGISPRPGPTAALLLGFRDGGSVERPRAFANTSAVPSQGRVPLRNVCRERGGQREPKCISRRQPRPKTGQFPLLAYWRGRNSETVKNTSPTGSDRSDRSDQAREGRGGIPTKQRKVWSRGRPGERGHNRLV